MAGNCYDKNIIVWGRPITVNALDQEHRLSRDYIGNVMISSRFENFTRFETENVNKGDIF